MIYKINNKFYLKVQGYYKEVDIKVDGDNLDITPNGNEIETYNVGNVEVFDVKVNKNNLIQMLNTNISHEENNFDGDTTYEEQRRTRRRRRM